MEEEVVIAWMFGIWGCLNLLGLFLFHLNWHFEYKPGDWKVEPRFAIFTAAMFVFGVCYIPFGIWGIIGKIILAIKEAINKKKLEKK